MKIDILTLFPDMFDALNHSILGKAKDKDLIDINIVLFYFLQYNIKKYLGGFKIEK